mgnify:CR=1 FL=1
MLQNIRDGIAKILVYLLFGVLILSFALWGTTDFFGQGAVQNVIAEVGDSEITAKTIERQYRRQIDTLRKRGINEEQARKFGVLESVIERAVDASVYDLAAEKLGLTVATSAIERDIRDRFGQIGSVQFDQLLRDNGYTLQEYEAARRVEIPRMQMIESFSAGAAGPKKLLNYLYKWQAEQRSASVFKVSVAKNVVPKPKESDLIKFHSENSKLFTSPEYRNLVIVHIDPAKIAQTIKLNEADLKQIYQGRISDFTQAEKRKVSQILFETQKEADRARAKIEKGLDFDSVAELVAGQDKKTTQLGSVSREDLPNALAKEVFRLGKGKVSNPVKDEFGYRILKIDDVLPERVKLFSEVKAELAREARQDQALEDVIRISNSLEDSLGKGLAIEEAAAEQGLDTRRIMNIDQGGRDENGQIVANIPGKPFLRTLFNAAEGQDTFMTETAAGGFFVLRVNKIKKSSVIPLQRVKERVRIAWNKAKQIDLARMKAENLSNKINDGDAISRVASSIGAKVFNIGPTNRFDRVEGIPSDLITKLFKLKAQGKASFSRGNGEYFVASLTRVTSLDGRVDKKAINALKNEVKISMVSDILSQFQSAIREKNNVSVNKGALKQFFDSNEDDSGAFGDTP